MPCADWLAFRYWLMLPKLKLRRCCGENGDVLESERLLASLSSYTSYVLVLLLRLFIALFELFELLSVNAFEMKFSTIEKRVEVK